METKEPHTPDRSFLGMEKTSLPSQDSAPFPIPCPAGTTHCYEESPSSTPRGIQKGWYSERVPHPSNRYYYSSTTHHHPIHRHASTSTTALMPFNSARRSILPSKWDDAERWICSPTVLVGGHSCDSSSSKSNHHNNISGLVLLPRSERHVKSKSGPLGSIFSGFGYYGNYSPVTPTRISAAAATGGIRKMTSLDSPLNLDGGRRSCPGEGDQEDLDCARDWLQMLQHDPHSPGSQDGRFYSSTFKDGELVSGSALSRKEMATEMSDNGGRNSSSSTSSSINPQSSSLVPVDPSSAAAKIKDVQIDKATSIRLAQHNEDRIMKKNSSAGMSSDSDNSAVTAPHINLSKLEREEKKINAWENLQKAKAEAAIHKLEMKLERKRSASMDRITKKLRRAEMKAQKIRRQLYEGNREQISKTNNSSTTYKDNCFCKCVRMSLRR